MSAELELIDQSVTASLQRHCTPERLTATEGGWDAELWNSLEQAGFTLVAVPEAVGGSGGRLSEIAVIVRAIGRHAAPIPLADTALLGGWLLAEATLEVPPGPLAAAIPVPGRSVDVHCRSAGRLLTGRFGTVPWAGVAEHIVLLARDETGSLIVALVRRDQVVLQASPNMAMEPHAEVLLEGVEPLSVSQVDEAVLGRAWSRGALARSLLMAGALERVLELSVRYAKEREQFGRPIGEFQAVQRLLALLAEESAASSAIVEVAVDRLEGGDEAACWAAKCRAGEAAGVAAAAAHQVHGAIGFTDEHQLRHFTRRLWAWRDEYGTEAHWAAQLGQLVQASGETAWSFVTAHL